MQEISAGLGVSTNDFALNAILYYMKRIKDRVNLKSEMETWENAGIEDLLKFEKTVKELLDFKY
ncbi:hypothetical protein A3H53_00810 [Candidatus Nomurabacteria bacterium RIFCSPLOWO2_02_FULL_40_10]|uniref:Uncharacterized protein n=2 Tax=Candidatus Nomuraibacteriota TaxID=1752729 RepID=A0A1F6XYD6_9BACT|nr:MAG: hypothetical protein A2642_05110 [Candidatus Nomurabacteria bacterium RIFCSPHIGHO2_01_FULL_39_10]OGI99103.1 MAG: hypothetical protein A3H53_00810 [Candidatus Nomurabacteria bacterium RIFCSPLOWO2_02_FULL_40_10]